MPKIVCMERRDQRTPRLINAEIGCRGQPAVLLTQKAHWAIKGEAWDVLLSLVIPLYGAISVAMDLIAG